MVINNNHKKSDQKFFTNLNSIELPKSVKTLPKLLLYFILILVVVMIFIPWQQTSKGIGHVIALDPNDRAQNIMAPIEGRIKKWYVQDGSMVKEGDKLVEVVDNDPLILDRLVADRDAKKENLMLLKLPLKHQKLIIKDRKTFLLKV